MDFGTTSDVIIALSNIAMAIAAVFAAYKANDWLSERKHSNSFEYAIKLLTEFDELKSQQDRLHLDLLTLPLNHTSNIIKIDIERNVKKFTYDAVAFHRKVDNSIRYGISMKDNSIKEILAEISIYSNKSWEHVRFFQQDPSIIWAHKHFGKYIDQSLSLDELWKDITLKHKALEKPVDDIFSFDH
ncbi:hypothetical protein Q7S_14160 [Rahnella aquatilis HX2]|nr:hypothetical protein Q7S_14160 [Rahnella aquatilis HX2]